MGKVLDAISAIFDRAARAENTAQRMLRVWSQPGGPRSGEPGKPRARLSVVGQHLTHDRRGRPLWVPLKYQSPVEPKPCEAAWKRFHEGGFAYA